MQYILSLFQHSILTETPINFFICKLFLFYDQECIPANEFVAKCTAPRMKGKMLSQVILLLYWNVSIMLEISILFEKKKKRQQGGGDLLRFTKKLSKALLQIFIMDLKV